MAVFDSFAMDRVRVGEVTLRVRHGGRGPGLLLLHGHPRTHTTWHRVAPALASRYSVVCPDLRGYGESTKPPTTPAAYSKRAMAGDMVALMRTIGHDRGSYVAFRLAMDHPERVSRLTVVDSVPIGEALARCDARFAREWYHWFFFAQPEIPERVINADPDAWYGVGVRNTPKAMGEENFADFRRAVHNPETVRAMLEDYRAGLGIDRAHDDADRAAGRRVACPTQVLWSGRDDMADLYGDVLEVWRPGRSGPRDATAATTRGRRAGRSRTRCRSGGAAPVPPASARRRRRRPTR